MLPGRGKNVFAGILDPDSVAVKIPPLFVASRTISFFLSPIILLLRPYVPVVMSVFNAQLTFDVVLYVLSVFSNYSAVGRDGDVIIIIVNMSKPIFVFGFPILLLNFTDFRFESSRGKSNNLTDYSKFALFHSVSDNPLNHYFSLYYSQNGNL